MIAALRSGGEIMIPSKLYSLAEIKKLFETDYAYFMSNYDKQHNIKSVGSQLILESKDLLLYSVLKDDKSSMLKIAFRVGLDNDKWFIWTISKNQANILITDFPRIYRKIDGDNKQVKNAFWG